MVWNFRREAPSMQFGLLYRMPPGPCGVKCIAGGYVTGKNFPAQAQRKLVHTDPAQPLRK